MTLTLLPLCNWLGGPEARSLPQCHQLHRFCQVVKILILKEEYFKTRFVGFLPWTGIDLEATPEMVPRLAARPSVFHTRFIDSVLGYWLRGPGALGY